MLEAAEREKAILNAVSLGMHLWSKDLALLDCNEESCKLFGISKEEQQRNFPALSPEFQPDGLRSKDKATAIVKQAFEEGRCVCEWMHQTLGGEPIPVEITLVRVVYQGEDAVAAFHRDLSEHKQMMKEIGQQDKLLDTVNRAANMLLETESGEDVMTSIMKSMALIGNAIDVDRVQIWKNETIDGALCFVHSNE